jgi:hypothetical protein
MLAQMKYPSRVPSDAFSALLYDICIKSNGPANKSSVVSQSTRFYIEGIFLTAV